MCLVTCVVFFSAIGVEGLFLLVGASGDVEIAVHYFLIVFADLVLYSMFTLSSIDNCSREICTVLYIQFRSNCLQN